MLYLANVFDSNYASCRRLELGGFQLEEIAPRPDTYYTQLGTQQILFNESSDVLRTSLLSSSWLIYKYFTHK